MKITLVQKKKEKKKEKKKKRGLEGKKLQNLGENKERSP